MLSRSGRRPRLVRHTARRGLALAAIAGMAAASLSFSNVTPAAMVGPAPASLHDGVPTPDHVVVVVMENKNPEDALDPAQAPYLSGVAAQGAVFTDSRGVARPSQPNYLALFAGQTYGVTSNMCPLTLSGPNLAGELIDAGRSFAGFSEDLPFTGFTGCLAGDYRRKHEPWVNFEDLPASLHRPFTEFGPDFSALPTVAFVVPDLCHDTHNCKVADGDRWVQTHIDPYLRWAHDHNSLLVVTWDEGGKGKANRIATVFLGPMVRPGRYSGQIDHFRVLRTIEDMYDLRLVGETGSVAPIEGVWALGTAP
jgi:acid phosphatase